MSAWMYYGDASNLANKFPDMAGHSGDVLTSNGTTGAFWAPVGSGSTGATGADGATGATGATGAVGFVWVTPPASAGATGATGDVAYDSTHFYLCIGENSWVGVTMGNVW